jgi:Cd2+/Zn2+-exporting ATPase
MSCSCCQNESSAEPGRRARSRWRIEQMDCPTEEAMIRKRLGVLPGVHELDFNLLERVLSVEHAVAAGPGIQMAIRELGMTPVPLAGPARPEPRQGRWPWTLALAGLAAAAAEVLHWTGRPAGLVAALSLAAVAGCGLGTLRKGWLALRRGDFNINALMSLAVTGALLLGEWPEAAMVMVLFALAERIESASLERARNAIHGLLELAPASATVRGPEGAWSAVPAQSVAPGALARVAPGERIPLDGRVTAGQSTVNQAPITGEALPVDKGPGAQVFAGTLNLDGSFEFQVTAAAGDTTLAHIGRAISEAQEHQAPTHRFVDRFARAYTPAVLAIALAVALLPPLLAGGGWSVWIYRALVLLVIACPCALVISTPVTIVSGLAAATRHGILIKGGRYLEEGRRLTWLAFDKTGTLTEGRPALTDAVALGDMPEDRAWQLAVSLADRSDHPLSRALVRARPRETRLEVRHFTALPGQGVRGEVDGITFSLGNHHLIEQLGVCSAELEARLEALESTGRTTLMLTDGRQVLALFALADQVRPGSRAAVAELHALGLRTLMLTGDNAHTAAAIAAQVGIDQALGDQLPGQKVQALQARRTAEGPEGGLVGMVGDGINDGPALAHADIGFAMAAAGSDTALETADVALMDDDLGKLARFVRLSRDTHRVLRQNFALAIGIKAGFLALTVAGKGTLWMAVFADMGASLLVIGNGLRMLRK